MPAAGGTPAERLTTLAPGEVTHRWPQVLPGGRAVLYTVSAVQGNYTNAWLAVQPLPSGTPHSVQPGGSYGRYLPSGLGSPKRGEREGGHLTWVHDGTLFAAPFDLATLAVTGPAVPVVPGVMSSITSGGAQVEVSRTGHARVPSGRRERVGGPARLADPRRENDAAQGHAGQLGRRADRPGRPPAGLLATRTGRSRTCGRYDVEREAPTRLTSDSGVNRNPVWTPDGQRLVYASSGGGGVVNLYWQRADRSGDATRLTTSPNVQYPGSWDPRGRLLAFQENRPETGAAI